MSAWSRVLRHHKPERCHVAALPPPGCGRGLRPRPARPSRPEAPLLPVAAWSCRTGLASLASPLRRSAPVASPGSGSAGLPPSPWRPGPVRRQVRLRTHCWAEFHPGPRPTSHSPATSRRRPRLRAPVAARSCCCAAGGRLCVRVGVCCGGVSVAVAHARAKLGALHSPSRAAATRCPPARRGHRPPLLHCVARLGGSVSSWRAPGGPSRVGDLPVARSSPALLRRLQRMAPLKDARLSRSRCISPVSRPKPAAASLAALSIARVVMPGP